MHDSADVPSEMFVRTVTRRQGAKTYQYLYVVEGRRVGGRVRQRIASSLGRADVLASPLDKVLALLRPYTRARLLQPHEISAEQGLTYGPVLVARRLWDQLGIGEIIRRHCPSRPGLDVAETAFVLTAHRLLHPGSEHAPAWRLEESWVADGTGQRICPQWETHGRVRVVYRQVRQWSRTLDHLIAAKEAIETDLYFRLRDLFGVRVECVLRPDTYLCRRQRAPAPRPMRLFARRTGAYRGSRYFTWRLTPDGQFQFALDRMTLRAGRRVEGTYLLPTTDRTLDAGQTVAAYKELLMVERAVRELTGSMELRPISHQTQRRVRAHLFAAHLAVLLGCALHTALTRAGLTLALDTASDAVRPIRLVELDAAGQRLRLATRPGPHGQAVLRAVGIHQLTPPGECCGKQKSKTQENQAL